MDFPFFFFIGSFRFPAARPVQNMDAAIRAITRMYIALTPLCRRSGWDYSGFRARVRGDSSDQSAANVRLRFLRPKAQDCRAATTSGFRRSQFAVDIQTLPQARTCRGKVELATAMPDS